MLFDTHAHYDDERFLNDADDLLSKMRDNNVYNILNSCSDMTDIPKIFELCRKYPFIYASVGIHPSCTEYTTENDMKQLLEYTKEKFVVAIGEIGLDYHYDYSSKALQKKWFSRQINLAKETGLPVIIHDREAHGDCMDILRSENVRDIGGVFHCYSGSTEMSREILDWGMYIAFGGTLTFKNSVHPVEVAKYVPLDRILIETDSPYLAPEPYRGKRNSSLYIHLVAEKLAEIRGLTIKEIEKITYENAKKCFRIEG